MTEKRKAAVTGIGVISPLGNTSAELYEALKAGRSGIRAMTEWKEQFGHCIAGAPVNVDPAEVKKINRKVRRTMGNAALFAGLAAQDAVRQSGLDPEIFGTGRTACVIGSTVGSASSMTEACIAEYENRRDDLSACHFFRLMSHSSSFNVADMLGINGPQLSTNSACASGLQALGMALELIQMGKADVVVADGFTGNIFLKSSEGMAKIMSGMIKAAFKKNLWSKLGYLHVKKGMDEMSETLDYKTTGGAMLLGINGNVVKAHGSSDAWAFYNALRVAKKLAEQDVVNLIKKGIENA